MGKNVKHQAITRPSHFHLTEPYVCIVKLGFKGVYTLVKGLSNLKPFRIKIILKIILLKDETKNI